MLDSAAARPRSTVFGADAYPDVQNKAAALLHSVVSNYALVDGNKRLGLTAVIVFYSVNGHRLQMSNAAAYDLIIDIAAGRLVEVAAIAAVLTAHVRPA